MTNGQKTILWALAGLCLLGLSWAGDIDNALATCEKKHSREVCLHSLNP